MKKKSADKSESDLPVVVWLDDSIEMWQGERFLQLAERRLADLGISFEPLVFTNTDDAIQFIIYNPERVFMVIQDTFRNPGTIVPGWKALRPNDTPPVGFRSLCGDFSTYVMDAFAPEATQVYYGAYYSEKERSFLEAWERADSRERVPGITTSQQPWKTPVFFYLA